MKTLTTEQKETRRKEREAIKREIKIQSEKDQRPVKSMTLTIEWKKSAMWGNNPNCEATVNFKDGSFECSSIFKCSGCGYDKESTVIAEAFNTYLKYKLYQDMNIKDGDSLPYGLNTGNYKYFAGGIGTSCYGRISEAIGGKFEHVAWGKTFDVYKYTENED